MKIQSVYKVPKGKLLKIFAEVDDNKETLQSIRITGDFFAYPEESITQLEDLLKNTPFTEKDLYQTISTFIKEENIQFIGIDADGLTDAIMRCT
jgi:lipoate-protein ligase A